MKIFAKIAKIIGIAVTTAILIGIGVGLVFYGSGYRYNLATKTIYQTGLIIAESYPRGATIQIDGKLVKYKTNTKIEGLKPGIHNISITKQGFDTFSKDVMVKEQLVTWVNYALLLPPSLIITKELEDVWGYTLSDDKRKAAIISGDDTKKIVFYDLSRREASSKITLQTETPIDWDWKIVSSTDSVALIEGRNSEKITPVWLLATEKTKSLVDLEEKYNAEFSKVMMNPDNQKEFFAIKAGALIKLHLDREGTQLIANKVEDFDIDSGKLYFVQKTQLGNSLISADFGGNNEFEILSALPASETYEISYTDFSRTDTVIVFVKDIKSTILIPKKGTSITMNDTSDHMQLSPDGRYLARFTDEKVYIHDFDEGGMDYVINVTKLSDLTWLFSESHLATMESGILYISDFDGLNKRKLVEQASGTTQNSEHSKKIYYMSGKNLHSIDISKSFENNLLGLN